MKDAKDILTHKVEKYDLKPRHYHEIKDQLHGTIVLPGFVRDRLTQDELMVVLRWNGISDEEPIYFEELLRPDESAGRPGKPPMAFGRHPLVRKAIPEGDSAP